MSDSMIKISYVSAKGRTVQGFQFNDGDTTTRPFKVFSWDAKGILKFMEVMGEQTPDVLEWFAAGDTLTSHHDDVTFGEWKGRPVIQIKVGGSQPVAFGKVNAAKLAHAIRQMGLDEVKATLQAYLGEYVVPKAEPKAAKGKGKAEKARPKAAKAARKPKVEADAPKAEADPRDEQIVALQAQMAEMMKAMQALLAAK